MCYSVCTCSYVFKHHNYTYSRLKSQVASKYGISSQPRLVDIIAAVPQEYKKVVQVSILTIYTVC